MSKSRPYAIPGTTFGSKYVFSFNNDGQLEGIKKQAQSGRPFRSVDPSSAEFTKVSSSSQALNAYNVNKYKGNKTSYKESVDDIEKVTNEEKNNKHTVESKKETNESFIATIDEYRSGRNIADSQGDPFDDRQYFPGFQKHMDDIGKGRISQIFAYPLDINPTQDHMKISRFRYQRADLNLSKPQNRLEKKSGKPFTVKNGDSTLGGKPLGSILLPMPKVVDTNGAEWGKSELNASGLLALGSADMADEFFSIGGRIPSTTQVNREQQKAQDEAKKNQERGDVTTGGFLGVGQAGVNQVNTTIASLLTGQELDQDTFLARRGGHVLNPNAEMLFQGPILRNFNFSFIMIARSEREGKEIRSLIRFLKLGLAPKFRNTTFLANPDVFKLEYKNGTGEKDRLKTVNQFLDGLALTTIAVDYSPNGYWSAYRDSQPVAVKMDLSFSELRPVYEQDQLATDKDSVGY